MPCEVDFCYMIVKTHESQRKITWSSRSAAKTTTVQEKMSKITIRKAMLGENSTAHQQSLMNHWQYLMTPSVR